MVHFTFIILFIGLAISITGFIISLMAQHEKRKVTPNYPRIKLIDKILATLAVLLFILMPCAIFLTFFTIALH